MIRRMRDRVGAWEREGNTRHVGGPGVEFYVEKLVFCLTGPYLTRRARHIEPPFSVGEVREVVEHLPRGGFTDAFHGPPPGGGASRRRAMASWWSSSCLNHARSLMGSRPRPPPEGEGGDEIGFSRTGRLLLGWAPLGGGRSARSLPPLVVFDRSCEGGGELEFVERCA